MIKLTYSDKSFEFSENILKISSYLNYLNKFKLQEDDALPLLNTTDEIFSIFKEWFDQLHKFYEIDFAIQIFKPEFFEKFDLKTLVNIFDFALSNQIKLLCDTIAFVIHLRNPKIEVGDVITIDGIRIGFVLQQMILKISSEVVIPYTVNKPTVDEIYSPENFSIRCIFPHSVNERIFPIPESLKEIVLTYGVEEISSFEFSNSALTKVVLPRTVKRIGLNSFSNCNCEIEYDGILDSIGESAFENSGVEKMLDARHVSTSAFENCSRLTSISQHIEKIEPYAFKNCSNLVNITIPCCPSEGSFQSCSLKNVVLSFGILEISEEAFASCTNLETIVLPSSLKKICSRAFYECESLKQIVLPESVEVIESEAFSWCGLTSIKIPGSVKVVEVCTFKNCTDLTSVIISEGVERICSNAFNNCAISIIVIPKSVEEIRHDAFSYCSNLSKIILPKESFIENDDYECEILKI